MEDRLLVTVTKELIMDVFSLDKMFEGTITAEKFYSKLSLESAMLEGKQGEAIKKLANQERQLSLSQKNSIFYYFSKRCTRLNSRLVFCSGNGIWVYRLLPLDKLVQSLTSKTQYVEALRACNSVFLKRLISTPTEREAIKSYQKHLITSYVDSSIKSGVSAEELSQILSIVFESASIASNVACMFGEIQSRFPEPLFWQHLSYLVKQKKVTTIPIDQLVQGADYLDQEDVFTLLLNTDFEAAAHHEADLLKIFKVSCAKELWCFVYKVCLTRPSLFTGRVLQLLHAAVCNIPDSKKLQIIKDTVWSMDPFTEVRNYLENSPEARTFFRLYWFVAVSFWPSFLPENFRKLFFSFSDSHKKLTAAVAYWIQKPSSLACLAEINFPLCMELCFWPICQSLWREDSVTLIIPGLPTPRSRNNGPKDSFTLALSALSTIEQALSDEHEADVAFLAIRVFIYSYCMDKHFYLESVRRWFEVVLSAPFEVSRFWIDFERVEKQHLEDLLISCLAMWPNKIDSEIAQIAASSG